ncbi:MAG: sulfotransferase domain-containing protein, partial [Geitlerinemataceae cyanobacterium]
HQHYTYLSRGLYLEQLQRWMTFFPRKQFLILSSEEFWEKPDRTLAEVFNFLQLPPLKLETYPSHNVGNYSQPVQSRNPQMSQSDTNSAENLVNTAGMSPFLRQKLNRYFQEPNQQLSAFLQRDFNWR